MPSRILAGAMSGTSADGVDVALVEITGRGCDMSARLIRHHQRPYDLRLRQSIFAIRASGSATLRELTGLASDIALVYAAAVNEALMAEGLSADDLVAVAAHGQTLFHDPPLTLQWLDPSLLAAEVGATVVSDFRRPDCAAGGQGAPLVPFADYLLFRDVKKNRVLLNIGGIANVTFIPAGGKIEQVIAFDTGPGNCITDWLCRTHEPEGPGFDTSGERAGRGGVVEPIAQAVLSDKYFSQAPPKSTDGPAMIRLFADAQAAAALSAGFEDLVATATAITCRSIADALRRFLPAPPQEIVASGGGTENATMMAMLAQATELPVRRTDDVGVPSAAKEAIAFALLGAATLDGAPASMPSVTGARRAVVLGAITPKP